MLASGNIVADVVLYCLDTSGSMWYSEVPGLSWLVGKQRLGIAKNFIEAHMDEASPDFIGLVTFNEGVTSAVPLQPASTARAEVRKALRGIKPSGDTNLYEAVLTCVAHAESIQNRFVKHINLELIVLTDGEDTSDGSKKEEVKRVFQNLRSNWDQWELKIAQQGVASSSIEMFSVGSEKDHKAVEKEASGFGIGHRRLLPNTESEEGRRLAQMSRARAKKMNDHVRKVVRSNVTAVNVAVGRMRTMGDLKGQQ